MKARWLYGAGRDLDALTGEQRRDVVALLVKLLDDHAAHSKALLPPEPHQHFAHSLDGWSAAKTACAQYEHTLAVIFRVESDELQLLAVAPRMGSACYRLAAERLVAAEQAEEPRWKRIERLRRRAVAV